MAVAAALVPLALADPPEAAAEATPHLTAAPLVYKVIAGCAGPALNISETPAFNRADCGFIVLSTGDIDPAATVVADLVDEAGTIFSTVNAELDPMTPGEYQVPIAPQPAWPAGEVGVRLRVEPSADVFAETSFLLNALVATVDVPTGPFRPGDSFDVTGVISTLDNDSDLTGPTTAPAGGAVFSLVLERTVGDSLVLATGLVAASDGTFTYTVTPAQSQFADAQTNAFEVTLAVVVAEAAFTDASGAWSGTRAGSGPVRFLITPDDLVVENSFVSAVGWVKPGETYPFRVFIRNYTADPFTGVVLTLPAPDGAALVDARPSGGGPVVVTPGGITWNVGTVPAAAADGTPATLTLVVEGRADSLTDDPQLVWKDLSTTASVTHAGSAAPVVASSHGPRVIPPDPRFDTARYGDRPFPVVPVDYRDRSHTANHPAVALDRVVNDPEFDGSTFNLYQEMSLGQLFPHGTVPSAEIASAGWDYPPGFAFTTVAPAGTCTGTTLGDAPPLIGSPALPNRIVDGWYQLPGDTSYYGGDDVETFTLASQLGAGIGPLGSIDGACGPGEKAVYDAAQIADPEIDYSDYDTDKDGVVDFFMMVFTGLGGNGDSQLNGVPPYDNIWPHSTSLEFAYTDPATGLHGYVSDDQLKDLEGRPVFYTDESRTSMTTTDTGIPVFVRVGPYNVNPESSFDFASVISHEYGHSLGLPDYYSNDGTRDTYGSWNLMATDHSHHMDVNARIELGWIVPEILEPGEQLDVVNWPASDLDTHTVNWVTPAATPYTLSGPGVHNSLAFAAPLPSRQLLDPSSTIGSSPTHVWWSTSGDSFGCPPVSGRNLDVRLPELERLAPATPVELTFNSLWDIEWDFDYGFVLVSTDGGVTYTSLPSAEGTTTPAATNPNSIQCQEIYGNGITGTSGSYAAGTELLDRQLGTTPEPVFLADRFDLTAFAGQPDVVLRFAYSTDSGLARPGWFIDDLRVAAGSDVIVETDFETSGTPTDLRFFPGGCRPGGAVAPRCSDGWQYIEASGSNTSADHAYYLELRDRSGFDLDGHGQADRGDPTFLPGLSLVYTDEDHGYGNVGVSSPPAQSPLDSQPQPGDETPDLDDAAFTAAAGDSHFSDRGDGWVDNYSDPAEDDGLWHFRFDCLTFDVLSMAGADLGPRLSPGDLTGGVSFDLGPGCAVYDYGFSRGPGSVQPAVVTPAPAPAPVAVPGGTPATGFESSGVLLGALGLAVAALSLRSAHRRSRLDT